jgi:glycosyltransferase involved in cell wall biosynthesis
MADPARRVLIVTREAPPSIGPHPIRVAKLVKYLPSFGWTPVVLTVPVDHAWTRDPELLEDLGQAEVVRVPRLFSAMSHPTGIAGDTADAVPDLGLRRRRYRRRLGALLIPDASVTWALPAARRAARIADRVDALLTTAPPFSTHLVGLYLARVAGIPWVAEYRDNWTTNPLYRRSAAVNGVNRWLEARILHAARRTVVISGAAASELSSAYPFAAPRIRVAGNGFDPDDLPPPAGDPECFTIAYVGSLDERRDPRPFLAAIEIVGARIPSFSDDLRLHLIGNVASWVSSAAAAAIGADRVSTDGLLPHREALIRASRAAVLLGITTTAEAGGAGTTSKLFDYLGLKRPILMLAPAGPAAELVGGLEAGAVARPDRPEAIAEAIEALYAGWRVGRERVASDEQLRRYTRSETARHVAKALDEAVARSARPATSSPPLPGGT